MSLGPILHCMLSWLANVASPAKCSELSSRLFFHEFLPLRIRRIGFFLPYHATAARHGEQTLLAASRSGSIDPRAAAVVEVVQPPHHAFALHFRGRSPTSPSRLNYSSSARGNADSCAASCWLRGSSSARVPPLRGYYRTCNSSA